jgi:hypothetical protein
MRGRVFLALLWVVSAVAAAEPVGVDYNEYYRFPFSIGIEYQNLSPVLASSAGFSIIDLAGSARLPLRGRPTLQPMRRGGAMRFESLDEVNARWNHTAWHLTAGIGYFHRFARTFELGGEALVGYTSSVYPDLLPEAGTFHDPGLIGSAALRLTLDPSYNISVDVRPGLAYVYGLGPLSDFDGPLLGMGVSISYRFGRDPDAPGRVVRDIRFENPQLGPVFAAMQSYYVRNPVGSVTLVNTSSRPITDLVVSFLQPGYMDGPTPVATHASIDAGASVDVPIVASYNQEVFRTEGVVPLTGEISVHYVSGGQPVEQSTTVSYDLYDRTSIVWNDDRKVGAFITPSDSALRNYVSFIRQSCRDLVVTALPEAVQTAAMVFAALGEIGCLYQSDPVTPFARAAGDTATVDTVTLPRDTLVRVTGDCDDLTVLYCSLLEAAGVETGFITIPGHIYAAVATGLASARHAELTPDRDSLLSVDGELWIPVEVTLIGKASFAEAWRVGAEEWAAAAGTPSLRTLVRTHDAQELYRPVGLRETDLGLQYGSAESIRSGFRDDLGRIASVVLDPLERAADASARPAELNRLGIRHAQFGNHERARESFERALEVDPNYRSARINLANVLYLEEAYSAALEAFERVHAELEEAGQSDTPIARQLSANIARVYEKLGNAEAATRFARAAGTHAGSVARDDSAADGGRASEAPGTADVLFVEEEER